MDFFIPPFPPAWADVFGEDDFGVFAECSLNEVAFVWRWIPPGTFLMGSPEDEPGRYGDEGPQHRVTISRGFWLGEAPVTQAQWRAITGENPSRFQGPEELPVEQVNWHDSVAFTAKLNERCPRLFAALPTEAQWEYACRAGSTAALYTGGITLKGQCNAPELDPIAWYAGNSGNELEVTNPYDSKDWPEKQYPHTQAGTHRVKQKLPNAWGLYDMLGNVWEWCADGWDEKAYQSRLSGVTDPVLLPPDDSADRVLRGGSWFNLARNCRAAYRFPGAPGNRWYNLGLRLAAGQEQAGAERPSGPERRSRGGGTPPEGPDTA